ncbi:hypothetical protein ULO1_24070 [Carboxydocella sp. ULO1]|nr:hypothetical protein ULO1_24070 [Carboxydocella sp. ULO1]
MKLDKISYPGNHFKSFEPTYEELKHINNRFIKKIANSFEPTYEELKHVCLPHVCLPQVSFEPTYEELKRVRSMCD